MPVPLYLYDDLADQYARNRPAVEFVRRLIRDQHIALRPDAELCLLVLYAQMIIRPQAPEAIIGESAFRETLSLSINLQDEIERSVQAIFDKMRKVDEPISAHRVLIAIDRAWPMLERIHGWA